MIFRDRKHAGNLLAERLGKFGGSNCLVLALPRGGVPVAGEVARILNAPLDILLVRKIGAPLNPEYAVGAICEHEPPMFRAKTLEEMGLAIEDLDPIVAKEKSEIARQMVLYRGHTRPLSVFDKTVILVDDGLATGTTAKAAVKYLKGKDPARIVVAVPVAAASSSRSLRKQVDELVVVEEREDLSSVGQWYDDFSQVSDDEVIAVLDSLGGVASAGVQVKSETVQVSIGDEALEGDLNQVTNSKALIIFAHGSGSSRKSPRNREVATMLNEAGFSTLLFDLLTPLEAKIRVKTFDIDLLSQRLVAATHWVWNQPQWANSQVGYFGASTGAAAALRAATAFGPDRQIFAIVSRGGRPDLADDFLVQVKAPTLLIVGSKDEEVLVLNQGAQQRLRSAKLSIVSGATHLFEESGALEEVARRSIRWFDDHLD